MQGGQNDKSGLFFGTQAGWTKCDENPILGGKYGTCFDVSVLNEDGIYRMWFSWRPKKSIALVESKDGIHWSEPEIVLSAKEGSSWEGHEVNRPYVMKTSEGYKMWYTGQMMPATDGGTSAIGYAVSKDGITWERVQEEPVLSAVEPWEMKVVMCPHVMWDEAEKIYKMWYSAGEQIEPNDIGYATSPDGINWTKLPANPIFRPDPTSAWENFRATASFVMKHEGWYLMFYIGFSRYNEGQQSQIGNGDNSREIQRAHIGIARSRDGITGWERHPSNPIISPTWGSWDACACYKPFVLLENDTWIMWYNGRDKGLEQVGLAFHEGRDLGF